MRAAHTIRLEEPVYRDKESCIWSDLVGSSPSTNMSISTAKLQAVVQKTGYRLLGDAVQYASTGIDINLFLFQS
jgi:hypothetical protein